MNVIQQLEKEQQKAKVPALRAGDTVKVHAKVVEGTRERIQVFHLRIQQVVGAREPILDVFLQHLPVRRDRLLDVLADRFC